jgi:hypothetical protein
MSGQPFSFPPPRPPLPNPLEDPRIDEKLLIGPLAGSVARLGGGGGGGGKENGWPDML